MYINQLCIYISVYRFAPLGLLWLQVTLSVVGKMCVSSGFEVIYILSTELFPTVVRNVGLGTSSACARAGSMVSPYIAQLVSITSMNTGTTDPA